MHRLRRENKERQVSWKQDKKLWRPNSRNRNNNQAKEAVVLAIYSKKKVHLSLLFRRKPMKRQRPKKPKRHVSVNLRISSRPSPEFSQTLLRNIQSSIPLRTIS